MKKMTEKEAWLRLAETAESKPRFLCNAVGTLFREKHIRENIRASMMDRLFLFRPMEWNDCSDAWFGSCSTWYIDRQPRELRTWVCLFLAAMCE